GGELGLSLNERYFTVVFVLPSVSMVMSDCFYTRCNHFYTFFMIWSINIQYISVIEVSNIVFNSNINELSKMFINRSNTIIFWCITYTTRQINHTIIILL